MYSLGRHSDHGSPRVSEHYQGGDNTQHSTLNTTGDHSVESSHCIVRGGTSTSSHLSGPTEMSRHDLTENPSSPALTPETRLELVWKALPAHPSFVQIIGVVGGSQVRPGLAHVSQLCENIPHGHPQVLGTSQSAEIFENNTTDIMGV